MTSLSWRTRRMQFVWEKLGLVFGPDGLHRRPWMASHAQAPASLLLGDRIRIYFSSRPTPDLDGQYVSYSAFVDLDVDDPRRVLDVSSEPVMDLGGRGAFDEFGIYPFSVVPDG